MPCLIRRNNGLTLTPVSFYSKEVEIELISISL